VERLEEERLMRGEVVKTMKLDARADRKEIDVAFGDLLLQARSDGGVKELGRRIHYEPDGTHTLLVRMSRSKRGPVDG
jgi:hypothetical protein